METVVSVGCDWLGDMRGPDKLRQFQHRRNFSVAACCHRKVFTANKIKETQSSLHWFKLHFIDFSDFISTRKTVSVLLHCCYTCSRLPDRDFSGRFSVLRHCKGWNIWRMWWHKGCVWVLFHLASDFVVVDGGRSVWKKWSNQSETEASTVSLIGFYSLKQVTKTKKFRIGCVFGGVTAVLLGCIWGPHLSLSSQQPSGMVGSSGTLR